MKLGISKAGRKQQLKCRIKEKLALVAAAAAVEEATPEGADGDCVRDVRVDDGRVDEERADDEAAKDNRGSDDRGDGGRVDEERGDGNGKMDNGDDLGEDGVELEGFSYKRGIGKGGELDPVGAALEGVDLGVEREVVVVECVAIDGVAEGPVADGAVDLEGVCEGPCDDDDGSDKASKRDSGHGDDIKIDSKSVDHTAISHTAAATVAALPEVTPQDGATLEETSPAVSRSKSEVELDSAASVDAVFTSESGEEGKKGRGEGAVEAEEADVLAPYYMAHPAATLEEPGGVAAVEESAIAAVGVVVAVPAGVVDEPAQSKHSTDGCLGKEPADGIVGDDAANGHDECVAGGIEGLVGEKAGGGGGGIAVGAGAETVGRVSDATAVAGEAAAPAAEVVDAAAGGAADGGEGEGEESAADADVGADADADAKADSEEAAEGTLAAEADAGADAEAEAAAAAAATSVVVTETSEAAATAKATSTPAAAEMVEGTPAITALTPAAVAPAPAPAGEEEEQERAAGEEEMSSVPDLDVSVDDAPLTGGAGADFRSAAAGLWSVSDVDSLEERKDNYNNMEEEEDEMREGVRAGGRDEGPGGSQGRKKGDGVSVTLGDSSYKPQQPDGGGAEAESRGTELLDRLARDGGSDKGEKYGVCAIETANVGDGNGARAGEEARGAGVECKEREPQEEEKEEEEEVVVVVVPSAKELAEKFLQVMVSSGVTFGWANGGCLGGRGGGVWGRGVGGRGVVISKKWSMGSNQRPAPRGNQLLCGTEGDGRRARWSRWPAAFSTIYISIV